MLLVILYLSHALPAQGLNPEAALAVFQDSDAPDSIRLQAAVEAQNYCQSNRIDSLRWISQAMLQHGRTTKSALWEAYAFKGLGAYQVLFQGNIDSARWYCQQALERTSATEENALHAKLLQNMGFLYYIDNQPDSSLHYMNEALPLAIHFGDQELEGTISNRIGVLYQNQTNYVKALQYFERSLKVSTPAEKVSIEINIAHIFEQHGMTDFAAAHARNAFAIAEELGNPDKLLSAYIILTSSGVVPLDSLDSWIQKAETLASQHDNFFKLAQMYSAVSARYLNEANDPVNAEQYAQKAIELAATLRIPFLAIKPRIDLAFIRLSQKKFAQGLQLIRENASLMGAKGSELFALSYHLTASELYEGLGQIDSAYHHLKQIGLRSLLEQGKPVGMNRSEMVAYMDVLHKQTKETLAREKAEAQLQASKERNRRLQNMVIFSILAMLLLSIASISYIYYRRKTRLANQLLTTNAQLECFSNIVSHDILTNLDIILSSGRLVSTSSPRPEHLLQYHTITQNTARQLKDYCLQMLQEARKNPGLREVALHDPMPAFERVRQRLHPAIEECGLELEVRPLSPAPLSPVLCEQVFQNLLSNAIRHGATAPKPVVRIYETRDASGKLAWVLEDNGPGIPPEHREALFAHTSRIPPQGKGQQMGLALLQANLREHQAQLHLEDNPRGGACFVLTFHTNLQKNHG
jgi:signal transduction histidine kinase